MAGAPRTFWLINQYASTPQTGMGGRHYYLARELAKQGHRVYLVAAGYSHLLHEPPAMAGKVELRPQDGFNLVWLRMPPYPAAHSKRRVLNWFRFAGRLLRLPRFIAQRPDAILYSSPSLPGYLAARRLARHYGVPLTFEVRDLWPLTLTELGGYSPRHPFIIFLQWLEDRAYRTADRVVFNLSNAGEHLRQRGADPARCHWLPNGYAEDEFAADPAPAAALPAAIRRRLPPNKFLVGYVGTLGLANGLDSLLAAAETLAGHDDLAFVLVGGGGEKERLLRQARAKGLTNVIFLDPIAKVLVPSMLRRFQLCFIGWRRQALYRFGIGANKIPEYFAAGRPVLHAYSGQADPVALAGAGLTVPAEDAAAIARAVLTFKEMPATQRRLMGERGRAYAARHYEYGALARRLSEIMLA